MGTQASSVQAEISAFSACGTRGDVMPICFWLTQAAHDGQWEDHARVIRAVGPACDRDALHRACTLMPRASEPKLLRAAAILADLRAGREADLELAWRDLVEVAGRSPHDRTAHVLLTELAWTTRSAA
jgi:hypothetical protein